MQVNFRSFSREPIARLSAQPGVNNTPIKFKGHCVVLVEDAGTPYDITLACRRSLIPTSFSIVSKNDYAVLQVNENGIPTKVILIGFDNSGRAKYKVEIELDLNEEVTGLRFCLPPDRVSAPTVEGLTDIREAVNNVNGSELATGDEVNRVLDSNPAFHEAFNSGETHLTLLLGLLEQSLLRARALR